MDRNELLSEIDAAYYQLDRKQAEIVYALFHRIFHIESCWYNGHYYKKNDGQWYTTAYPIPVINVKGVCDIQIHFDRIIVCARLDRKAALTYSFEKMKEYAFCAYNADDPFSEYYHAGRSIQDMRDNVLAGDAAETEFSFLFPFDVEGKVLFSFVKLLKRECFYY